MTKGHPAASGAPTGTDTGIEQQNDGNAGALRLHRYRFAENMVSGRRVLDIGSGDGTGARLLARRAASVLAVVSDVEGVPQNADGVTFLRWDGLALPVSDGSVDLVTALEQPGHATGLVSEARRVLSPGGVLLVAARIGEEVAIRERFAHVAVYGQGMQPTSVLWPLGRPDEALSDTRALGDPQAVLILASDAPVDGIAPLGTASGETQDRLLTLLHARYEQDIAARLPEVGIVTPPRKASGSGDASQSMPRLLGKLALYRSLAAMPGTSTTFRRKLDRKVAKYQERLTTLRAQGDAAKAAPVAEPAAVARDPWAPVPLSEADWLLFGLGSPHIVGPGSADVPDVSIVIPVYNQCTYTLACLRSLLVHQTSARFEVIVVDDCSTDETPERLRDIPWVRTLRQPVNGGFIASCNAGLAAARGTYVLFLNNDTEVLPGWLDELVGTFATFPEAGLVGSRLIYPDGRLQESGGILWRDGRAWNYGRKASPRAPHYCYARQVDYCSGASILLPRELMVGLGGFDTHFAPAYCEDSDLAMRVRQAGRTVMVQPLSRVVHYEGVTSGTDLGQGAKAYQVANTQKLFARWRDVLAARPEHGDTPSDAKDFGLGKRLLVIDAWTPEPDRSAGAVTCFEIMRAAQALGFQVTFLPARNLAEIPGYTAGMQRIGIEAIYAPFCTSVEQHLEEQGGRYDVILAYRVGLLRKLLAPIRKHAPQARLVYQTSDLHHIREARQAEIENDPDIAAKAEVTKQRELMLVGAADATIVHSTYEKEYLAEKVPGAAVEVFNWILEPKGTDQPFAGRSGFMFLGGYTHEPNVDAVHWFLDEIWPLVRARLPGAVFHVVGSGLPDSLLARAGDGVDMLGFVEDLRPIMDQCRMSIAPLRYGAGTKGKVAMSLAYGLPVVTTTVGAEGMGLVSGEAVFIADDPQAFADRIVDLYSDADTWERMSRTGIDYVRRTLSREAGQEIVRRALIGTD